MAKRKSARPEVSDADEVLLHPHEYRRLSVGWQSIISHVIWCISPMFYACLHHCHQCGYDVSGSPCHRMPSPDVCASARWHRLVVPLAASGRGSIHSRRKRWRLPSAAPVGWVLYHPPRSLAMPAPRGSLILFTHMSTSPSVCCSAMSDICIYIYISIYLTCSWFG